MTPHHLLLLVCMGFLSGCAMAPYERPPAARPPQAIPTLHGSYYRVRRGETLWRIARSFGLEVQALADANRLPNATSLKAGQQLFIPLPAESNHFVWPVRGSVTSLRSSKELTIVSHGDLVRAARSGQVAVATHHLSGWGKTVILDHLDGHLTVYAGLSKLLVTPGMRVRQGTPIGSLGNDPLHFEIRDGAAIEDALALLPQVD